MFKDGNGATYSGTDAQFTTTPFGKELPAGKSGVADLLTTPYFTPYEFGTTFAQKVDNSVAGEMRDCGECHVGGGLMEYIIDPTKTTSGTYDPNARTSLRDYAFGTAVTAFNALIDIFNPTPANKGDVVVQDYKNVNGVLEMDCLICHQKDYSWEHRRDAVRKGEYDASRAMGAGLATSAKDGMNVFYNSTSVSAVDGKLVANLEFKIVDKPRSEQCSSCHLGNSVETVKDGNLVIEGEKYQVDWKKRGEMWTKNGTVLDVHGAIGCMGCHERTGDKAGDTANVGTTGVVTDQNLGLCDPAKGGASPFDALWNKLDKKEFKDCAGCHEYSAIPEYATFGAPNSKGAHDRAGLTAEIAYNAAGQKISHIDLIDCTACHIRKDGFSGGAFVDGTGADEQGRLTIHDTEHVAKGDMKDGVGLHWQDGKLYADNLLTSFFWRDMNGLKGPNGGLDINNDGVTAGMDALLQTHVNNINIANGLHGLTHDGVVTAAEIETQRTALKAGIKAQLGNTTSDDTHPFIPRLSFLLVPFKASHNIASADRAWGKNGCKECHAADAGFYNGTYPINGNLDGKFNFAADQVNPFTKVNGSTQPTDSHPNVKNKKNNRTIAVTLLNKTAGTLYNIDRSEMLYEGTFLKPKTAFVGSIQGDVIKAACTTGSPFYCSTAAEPSATSTLGWFFKVDVKTGVDAEGKDTIVKRTIKVMNDKVTTVDQLLTALGSVGGDYFTVAAVNKAAGTTVAGSNDSLLITAKTGYQVRMNPAGDVGPLGLANALYEADPIVRGTNSYATRADFVAYLNGIDAAAYGVGVAPVATISAMNGETGTNVAKLVKGSSYSLVSGATAANGASFKWATNAGDDGVIADAAAASTTVTFNKPGTFRVALTVTNVDGATKTSYKLVNVANPVYVSAVTPATTTTTTNVAATSTKAAYSYTTVTTKVKVTLDSPPEYDRVRFFWGDGSASTILTKAAFDAANVDGVEHKYNRYTKYLKNGLYTYKTTVQLFNGTSLVSSQSVIVEVP